MKTVKFGGTSLADARQIRKAAQIVRADEERCYVVVSAPGKRQRLDVKVTDLLYRAYDEYLAQKDYRQVLVRVGDRFNAIADELNVEIDVAKEIETIAQNIEAGRDYIASRGEYLSAKIFASYLGYGFVDAKDCVFFERGRLNEEKTYDAINTILSRLDRVVIPGFYGSDETGRIRTFSRGGSDITGSLVARAMRCDVYENWTDVNGLLCADPRVVDDPITMDYVSYDELRELSYMGASVLHEDAVFPCRQAGIPIHIRNTDHPEIQGTIIGHEKQKQKMVLGIAGKKGFSNIQIEKSLMNSEIGFGARVLGILADHHISYEHAPTSVDTMSVLVTSDQLKHDRDRLIDEIKDKLSPDFIAIEDGLALVAVVGAGFGSVGFAASLLREVAQAGVNVRCIVAGFSGMSLIIGVNEDEFELCMRSLYDGMIHKGQG